MNTADFSAAPIMDAHCHLSLNSAMPFADILVAHARARGIQGLFLGGTEPEEWDNQEKLDRQYPHFFHRLVGIHPWQVSSLDPRRAEEWLTLFARKLPEVLGAGEIGLDLKRCKAKEKRALQLELCATQLDIAASHGKPALLHVVGAHQEMLDLLHRLRSRRGGDIPVILHGFHGAKQLATRYLDHQVMLSLGPRILLAGSHETLVRFLPIDMMLIESDAPRQLKSPMTGHDDAFLCHNNTWFTSPCAIFAIAEVIGELRGAQGRHILEQCGHNLARAFALPV